MSDKPKIQTSIGSYIDDLTGKRYGRLVVQSLSNERTKNGKWKWNCVYDCGNTVCVSGDNLKYGSTKSCGCYKRELNTKDITGQKFNRLTVISKTDQRDRHESVIWKCLCDCGKICFVSGTSLRNGTVKSCGCLHKEAVAKNGRSKAIDLTNTKSGLLTPIKPTEKRAADGSIIWQCKCDCGNTSYVSSNALLQKRILSCGCLLSHGEYKVQKFLEKNKINFVKQKTFKDCINPKTNAQLRFDFYLLDYNCCLEYDGQQHFHYSQNGWNDKENFDKTQYRDSIKNKFCKDNNINLIRIPYTDYDKIDEQYILDILKPFENQTKDGDANDSAAI
jgi:hypothetical protein